MHRGKKEGFLRDVKVGEVVLVGSDNANNLTWPLFRVLDLIPGADLVVLLKTASGEVSPACSEVVSFGRHQARQHIDDR